VSGRHRERFLHSQVTSDVRALAPGEAQLSALLDAGGRLRAYFFLHKREDSIVLLVPEDVADSTVAQLSDHIIADDVAVVRRQVPEMRLVLGPESARLRGRVAADEQIPIDGFGSQGLVTWAGDELPYPTIDGHELEARRVVSGPPLWGREVSAGMLVNETQLLDTAVSLSKGCFLGQETVAKVASHRGAARYPVLLRVHGEISEPSRLLGERLATPDTNRAGTVRSVARWRGAVYLQASVARELRVEGMELECRFADGSEVLATVVSLPLIVTPTPEEQAEELYLRAVRLFAGDEEHDAVELLERAIAVCPEYADAYESLGVVLGRHRRYEEAIDLMRRLLEVDPDSVMAHTNMSVYYNQLGRIDDAEREARHAAAKTMERERRATDDADEERRKRNLAAEDRSRREQMFRQVLELDPEDGLANFGMGELSVEEGRFDRAVGYLEKALAADPNHSAAYLALGQSLEGEGDVDRARETYLSGVRVAANRGDLMTANRLQDRLRAMDSPTD
jgi:folate-binding protein YgfZ